MKLVKPKFWKEINFLSLILYPLSIFTYLINILKNFSLKENFNIKTICVGNIYLGGTGKTSLAIELHKLLNKKFKTVFVKKKYKNQLDEINLLKSKGHVILSNKRKNALQLAIKKKFEIAILDDGLQQKDINYNLKIACFNTEEGMGNGLMIPAGPLRENITEIKKYDFIFLNGEKRNNKLLLKMKSNYKNLKIFEGKYKPINLNSFDLSKKYLMFCGIGNPHEFERTLNRYRFNIKEKKIYPDHFKIPSIEIKKLKDSAKNKGYILITTEKDYFRLNKIERKNIKFLKTKLEIKNIKSFTKILLLRL